MDDDAAIELLTDVVSIPSVSGSEARVARRLVDAMRPWAREARIDAVGNVVAVVGEGPLRVTFLGHIDTVPGDVPVRREANRLYGRGAVDAKGPFCTAVAAASRLGHDARSAVTLTLIGAVEEEAPSSKGARHAQATLARPDALIVGEPSGWSAVTLGYKGRLVVECRVRTPNAHSAGDRPTAPELVVAAWQAIHGWAGEASVGANGVFDAVQATLQSVESGSDGLQQTARAVVGLRLPPAWPPEKTMSALAALPMPPSVELAFTGAEAPYRGPRDTILTRAFRTAIRGQGGSPRTNVKTGTSDMNVVAPAWNVPMLAYGPGDSGLDHTPEEHIELEEYLCAIRVLCAAIAYLPSPRRSQSPESS